MRTNELIGPALDWAVAKCEDPERLRYGVKDWMEQRRSTTHHGEYVCRYHQNWAQGGPIIEREKINLEYPREGFWTANVWLGTPNAFAHGFGPTPLIAGMRCYVASKLGDEVEIPEELK